MALTATILAEPRTNPQRRNTTTESNPMRVQIPAYTDRWMMGDRYGTVLKVTKARRNTQARLCDESTLEIAYVLLDKSNKTVRVVLADCVEI